MQNRALHRGIRVGDLNKHKANCRMCGREFFTRTAGDTVLAFSNTCTERLKQQQKQGKP